MTVHVIASRRARGGYATRQVDTCSLHCGDDMPELGPARRNVKKIKQRAA